MNTENNASVPQNIDLDTMYGFAPVIPDSDPEKPAFLILLSKLFLERHGSLHNTVDHDKAILVLNDAVRLMPEGNPAKPACLDLLGTSLFSRFERLGNIVDIDRAISACNDAVRLTSDGHRDKPSRLNNLCISVLRRFEQLGDIIDIDKAISSNKDAVRLTPDSHPNKPGFLNSLGSSFYHRFKRFGDIGDIEKAISAQDDAVRLAPSGNPNKAICLTNLGNSLLSRFERRGDIVDLDKAIAAHDDAAQMTPDGNPSKVVYLANFGNSLLSRFKHLGDIVDLDKAISARNDAVRLTPDNHSDKPGSLNGLGNSFVVRFKRFGDIIDIDNAISAHSDAVRLTPDDRADKPARLLNLGSSLYHRFRRLGDIVDIHKAISAQNDAVRLTPDNHKNKAVFLTNLGNSLLSRFERLGDINDIDKAVSAHNNAVRLTPGRDLNKAAVLANLARNDSMRLTPDGHPEKPSRLNNLGSTFIHRFKHYGNIVDIEKAISMFDDAVRLSPEGHPDGPARMMNLGQCFAERFECLGDVSDVNKAILQFSSAARSSVGPTSVRFKASLSWANCASKVSVSSSLDAYRWALDLLPRVAWLGLPMNERHRELADIGSAVREAAAAAITSGEFNTALEWLEQGRSIIWGQTLQLRNPVDDLRAIDEALASRLKQVSTELEQTSTRDTLDEVGPQFFPEEVGPNHRKLATEWDALVEKARALPGFEGFLKPKKVSELKGAARAGPVVVINIHTTRCDALVLRAEKDDVFHIPFASFSYDKGQELQISFNAILSANRLRGRDSRYTVLDTQPRLPDDDKSLKELLSELWLHVVKPVLDRLAYPPSRSDDPPRIWWCATGPLAFLPLHAAGLYDTEDAGSEIGDYVTSSYTPTLTALLDAPRDASPDDTQMLVIAQPKTPGHSALPNTTEELVLIRRRAGYLPFKSLESAQATVKCVVESMKKCGWIHLACHGTQHPKDPTKSALLLHDGRLELTEVIKMPLPHAEFAFLSACQTATGDERLSEESVHLAAGMLLAGYRGVIATTWEIRDDIAPFVADEVYARLLENHHPDRTRAAHALHRAVQLLRKREGVSFLSWVPFIHIGM